MLYATVSASGEGRRTSRLPFAEAAPRCTCRLWEGSSVLTRCAQRSAALRQLAQWWGPPVREELRQTFASVLGHRGYSFCCRWSDIHRRNYFRKATPSALPSRLILIDHEGVWAPNSMTSPTFSNAGLLDGATTLKPESQQRATCVSSILRFNWGTGQSTTIDPSSSPYLVQLYGTGK